MGRKVIWASKETELEIEDMRPFYGSNSKAVREGVRLLKLVRETDDKRVVAALAMAGIEINCMDKGVGDE